MTSPKLVFYLTCLFLAISAHATNPASRDQKGFKSANVGDSVILKCFCQNDVVTKYYWYKLTLGQKPQLMSAFYKYKQNGTFYGEFKENPRFTLDTQTGKYHLKITDLQISDSAVYYCASSHSNNFEFVEDITLNVKGSGVNIPALVHQSPSSSIQPGGSVTLNCTVHTGSCDGEHTVYWFKHSEESHPGLIYTHGGRNDQCERKANTQTHTCVYNLPVESLNRSHAGAYYCAVASCGYILFGDGTKLDTEYEKGTLSLVYFLSGACTFTCILSVLLAFSLCIECKKRRSCQCTESARFSVSSTTNAEGYTNEENLHYAALRINKAGGSKRQRGNSKYECVYSSVRH